MDQLTQAIESAAQTAQRIVREAHQRHDEQEHAALLSSVHVSSLCVMQRSARVNPRWHIAWPHWPPGLWAKAVALWQKVSRSLLSWYIEPIVHQQNEFNLATLNVIRALSREVLELKTSQLGGHLGQQARLDVISAQIGALERLVGGK